MESLSIDLKRGQSHQLGHFQNSIELSLLAIKNFLSSLEIAAKYTWNRWIAESKIFFTVWIELVMMTIFEIPSRLTA